MYNKFLTGERIFLREVRQSDVNENYYQWLNDPEINQYLETRFVPRSKENILEFVNNLDAQNSEPFFAICTIDNEEHIGNIKIGPINWYHRHGDISLFIGDKNCWGKGIATEAIHIITTFAFRTLNLHKVKAGCYANNSGSVRAFEKCGYLREGLLHSHCFCDGEYVDLILLGLTAEKYWNTSK